MWINLNFYFCLRAISKVLLKKRRGADVSMWAPEEPHSWGTIWNQSLHRRFSRESREHSGHEESLLPEHSGHSGEVTYGWNMAGSHRNRRCWAQWRPHYGRTLHAAVSTVRLTLRGKRQVNRHTEHYARLLSLLTFQSTFYSVCCYSNCPLAGVNSLHSGLPVPCRSFSPSSSASLILWSVCESHPESLRMWPEIVRELAAPWGPHLANGRLETVDKCSSCPLAGMICGIS